MQDHSHKLAFLALTGAMCAASLYGSQAGPSFFMSDTQPEFTRAASALETGGHYGLARAVNFIAPESEGTPRERAGEGATADKAPPASTATVLPNKTSCPAVSALMSPPSVNGAIGSPTPLENVAPPTQVPSDAVLGTGSSCPPVRHETDRLAKTPLDAPAFPDPRAANTLSRAGVHP